MKKIVSILGISNNKKTLGITLKASEEIIMKIADIFEKFEPSNIYFEKYYPQNDTYDYTCNPKDLVDVTLSFFSNEESGFIIFREKWLEIILLKNSKLFKDIEKEIFRAFAFVKPIKIKHKA